MAEANDQDFYDKVFPVPDRVREKSYVKSRAEYDKLYKESIDDPNAFWAKMATHPERLRVDVAGNGREALWCMAGRDKTGNAALLVANIGKQPLALKMAPIAGQAVAEFSL